jgi:ribosomal protein S18 acetylase RimI-like enzyme
VVPEPEQVRRWVERASADPAVTTIRTSALYPAPASRFRAAGFVVADRLALLQADLRTGRQGATRRRLGRADARTGKLRRSELTAAARIDQAAFGPAWSHDAAEIDEIRAATPHARVRARYRPAGVGRRHVLAFAVAGASNEHGYLQRLSVHPDHQRRGHGRALTLDALGWMARRNLRDCLVNTSVDNGAALDLYRSVGFVRLDEHLEVLELTVPRA